MKTTNLLLQTSALFLLALLMTTGCKKNETADPDPNIVSKTYNVSLTNNTTTGTPQKTADLDIDGDGHADFQLCARLDNVGGDTTVTQLYLKNGGSDNNVLTTAYSFPNGMTDKILKVLNNDDKINSSATEYSGHGFAVLQAYKGATLLSSFGFTDGADKLIGFNFKISSGIHYGWLKINVSSDLKTLTVKEGAYCKLINTEIAAGDK